MHGVSWYVGQTLRSDWGPQNKLLRQFFACLMSDGAYDLCKIVLHLILVLSCFLSDGHARPRPAHFPDLNSLLPQRSPKTVICSSLIWKYSNTYDNVYDRDGCSHIYQTTSIFWKSQNVYNAAIQARIQTQGSHIEHLLWCRMKFIQLSLLFKCNYY